MDGRFALIRDLVGPLAAAAGIFAVDWLSPPTLFVSVAYAGVALLVARPARARPALLFAAFATALIGVGLRLDGQWALPLSDAFVNGLLSIVLVWMVVLLGTTRAASPRAFVRFREMPHPAPDAALGSHVDIVKLTEAQRTLLDRLSLATQTAGLAIWDRDLVTNTVYLDDSFASVFGLRMARDTDDLCRVVHAGDLARFESACEAALRDSKLPGILTDRLRIVRETDKALRHVQVHRRLFRNARGQTERILGVAWDVTDEVTSAQALIEATEAAQAASRAKSALLANVSHEIRTPMNGIIGMTGLLLESPLTEAQRDYAETIRGSADSLLRVIEDILDFSKIEAGRMTVEWMPTDLHRTIDEVRALMSLQAAQKRLALHVDIDPDVPVRAMSDPQRLRQCLVNLVGNALKFTSEGTVTIAVKRIPQEEGEPMTRFEVRDTGIGIESEVMKRLFEPFVQADSSTTRNFGGTGLGLSIVKRFVEMMNGRVGVASVPGEGSSFWFDLPLVALDAAQHDAGPSCTVPGHAAAADAFERRFKGRVLVVEDNAVNQKVARRILERLGCEVVIAENGAEAVELCATENFDLVLMDMQMPVMDGLTATTLIRQREPAGRRTPIVALTANAMDGELDRCMAAGMDGFLTKPLSVERLRSQLSGLGLMDPAASPDAGEADRATAAPSVPPVAPLDLAKLEALSDGDAEFAREILELFFASAAQSLGEMSEALIAGDRRQLARAAHRLKGAAFNVHADDVAGLAIRLERDAQDATPESLATSIDDCRRLVAQAEEFVRQHVPGTTRAA